MIRYVVHAPELFTVPPGKTTNYMLVEYRLFPGRSPEAKRRLYESIVRRLGALGVTPADILIVIQEPPLENWGIGAARRPDSTWASTWACEALSPDRGCDWNRRCPSAEPAMPVRARPDDPAQRQRRFARHTEVAEQGGGQAGS